MNPGLIEHSLALPFFGIGMKTDLFQSCGHCWVFQIFRHIECRTFTALSFRIQNSSTGIPSSPLAFFKVMPPKANLTFHSRMSGSRWVITALWLSGSWRSFLYSSSVYSYHFFLISSPSVASITFLSFIEPAFAWNVPLKSSLVFPILLFSYIFCNDHRGRLSYLSLLFFGTLHSDRYIFPFPPFLSCFLLSFAFCIQEYMNRELPDFQARFRKHRGSRDQNCQHPLNYPKKKRVCQNLWLGGSQ